MTNGGLAAVVALRREPVLRSRAAKGDARAFAALYERHHQALYRYCRSILQHDEDARDAVQSTMTLAFAALRDEQRDFDLRPWLFRIAHNEAISALRRRRPTEELDRAAGLCRDDLVQHVQHRERLAHLRVDLGDLAEHQRSALVLRELSGLSHQEIAVVLDCSERSVKQTIFEARKALGECAEGRAMSCDEVERRLSDADRRVLRGRRMRSHVRSCRSCKAFQIALGQRPADLAALAPPLPVAAGAALLSQLLVGAQAGAGAAGVTGTKAVAVIAVSAALAGGAGTAATQVLREDGPTATGMPVGGPPGATAPVASRGDATPTTATPASPAAALSAASPVVTRRGGDRRRRTAGADATEGARRSPASEAGAGPGAATEGVRPPANGLSVAADGTRGAGAGERPSAHRPGAAAEGAQGAGADGRRPGRAPAASTGGRKPGGTSGSAGASGRRTSTRAPARPAVPERGRPAARGGPAVSGSPGTAQGSAAGRGEAGARQGAPPPRDEGPAASATMGPPAGAGEDPATPRAAAGTPSGQPSHGGPK